MAKQKCWSCGGSGMEGPLDDPDACIDCGGLGYYDDGCDDETDEEPTLYGIPSSKWVTMSVDDRKEFVSTRNIKIHTSVFIDEVTITHGFGVLEAEGTWQYPCEWLNYRHTPREE